MLTLPQFRTQRPEFAKTADPVVQAALDAAAARTDPAVFDTLTNEAHGWLAAHILAASPQGREARLSKSAAGSEKTLYLVERERLELLCGGGWGAT